MTTLNFDLKYKEVSWSLRCLPLKEVRLAAGVESMWSLV